MNIQSFVNENKPFYEAGSIKPNPNYYKLIQGEKNTKRIQYQGHDLSFKIPIESLRYEINKFNPRHLDLIFNGKCIEDVEELVSDDLRCGFYLIDNMIQSASNEKSNYKPIIREVRERAIFSRVNKYVYHRFVLTGSVLTKIDEMRKISHVHVNFSTPIWSFKDKYGVTPSIEFFYEADEPDEEPEPQPELIAPKPEQQPVKPIPDSDFDDDEPNYELVQIISGQLSNIINEKYEEQIEKIDCLLCEMTSYIGKVKTLRKTPAFQKCYNSWSLEVQFNKSFIMFQRYHDGIESKIKFLKYFLKSSAEAKIKKLIQKHRNPLIILTIMIKLYGSMFHDADIEVQMKESINKTYSHQTGSFINFMSYFNKYLSTHIVELPLMEKMKRTEVLFE